MKKLLIILGSPLWAPLLIAAFAVVLSLYVSLWAVIISLWAVFVSTAVLGAAVTVFGAGYAIFESALTGGAMLGAGLVLLGLSVFLYFGATAATKYSLLPTQMLGRGCKKLFGGRAI